MLKMRRTVYGISKGDEPFTAIRRYHFCTKIFEDAGIFEGQVSAPMISCCLELFSGLQFNLLILVRKIYFSLTLV